MLHLFPHLVNKFYFLDTPLFLYYNWDETISGDTYFNLSNGPVLSKMFDLIKGNGLPFDQCEWDIYFNKYNYSITL